MGFELMRITPLGPERNVLTTRPNYRKTLLFYIFVGTFGIAHRKFILKNYKTKKETLLIINLKTACTYHMITIHNNRIITCLITI